MTTKAIEAGARAFKACRPMQQDDILHQQLEAAFEAAIASGELVPASAVAAERERCAKVADAKLAEGISPKYETGKPVSSWGERAACSEIAAAIRALEPASGEYVLGWRDISTAPHETYVLLGWWDEGKWNCETGLASHGWRRNGVSNMSRHGQATHWRMLPDGPPLTAATSNGSGK